MFLLMFFYYTCCVFWICDKNGFIRTCIRRLNNLLWQLFYYDLRCSTRDAKEQVLANLANFSYDPDNYIHIKELNVVDLFLDHLNDDNKTLVEFAIGGICNLALDKNFKQLIYKHGGVNKVISCLSSEREETVLSAITALMFLVCPESKADITTASVIDCMLRFQESNNRRFSNLASVFLQDYCTPGQIQNAKHLSANYGKIPVSET